MGKSSDQQLLQMLRTGESYEVADALAELMGGEARRLNHDQLMGCVAVLAAQFTMGDVPREEYTDLVGRAYDVAAAGLLAMFPERKNR
jgi:hypothetical protein